MGRPALALSAMADDGRSAMPYEVIARRWRPKAFEMIVGQRHVTETLKNAIAADRMAHALLFAGPRGVGKTTTARIVAKALNCASGPTATPCGTCPPCEEIATGRSMDCIEVDAASNTQVEKTRELLETVQYAPGRGHHKIYIIDEAHMLSTSSFNALLKTLEEPPPRVIFILATTEPHRIPATIHSRCQRHDFRLLGVAEIGGRLREIVEAEGVAADEGALTVLSQAAAGSLRDAQSLLDQAIACLGHRLEAAAVADLLGLVRAEVLAEAAEAILCREAAKALHLVDELARHGQDLRQFAVELGSHLRDLAILKVCAEPGTLLEGARVDPAISRRQADRASLSELEAMLRALQQAEAEMRRSTQPRLILEMAVIRLTEIRGVHSVQGILDQLATLENRLAGPQGGPARPTVLSLFDRPTAPSPDPAPTAPSAAVPRPAPKPPEPDPSRPRIDPPAHATTAPPADIASGWDATVARLKGRKRLASVLAEVRPARLEADRLVLKVPNGNAFVRDTLEEHEARKMLAETASAAFGARLRVEYEFAPAEPTSSPTPTGIAAGAAEARPQDHPLVQEALSLFGGTIVRNGAS
jgi:DNA polymerase-3 subunit gamma/tau